MDLYPAIDLRGGRVVRLAQGSADRQTTYGDDPGAQADAFVAAGARWIHVVDLDRAFGQGDNDAAVRAIIAAVAGRAAVQLGGGVRSLDRALALVRAGVDRVVIGTAAVDQPELIDALVGSVGAAKVAIGIDARDGIVALRGWVESASLSASDLARRVAGQGVDTVIYTDIARDGMLGGPDINGSLAVVAAMEQSVAPNLIVSGGVASVGDLAAIASAGLGGAIIGRALYEGRFTLPEAITVVST